MNETNIEVVRELINKIIDINLSEDIRNGNKLLQLCKDYEIININSKVNNCVINNHQQKVLEFINDIIFKYSNLITIYNNLNGYNDSKNSQIDCKYLKDYIDFIEKVKVLKEKIDNIKDYDELINIINGK